MDCATIKQRSSAITVASIFLLSINSSTNLSILNKSSPKKLSTNSIWLNLEINFSQKLRDFSCVWVDSSPASSSNFVINRNMAVRKLPPSVNLLEFAIQNPNSNVILGGLWVVVGMAMPRLDGELFIWILVVQPNRSNSISTFFTVESPAMSCCQYNIRANSTTGTNGSTTSFFATKSKISNPWIRIRRRNSVPTNNTRIKIPKLLNLGRTKEKRKEA
mmetsp:Transcript_17114/g.26706  ORF Transcript_17114/g.26706 Transcript_17114/m.26706 type:complete len:218 (+) Transcript_17114:441-1094(+)